MASAGLPDRGDDGPILVHVWSGPRCLSTSLMYSFAQRPDVGAVLDEPLYAAYLRSHPDVARPPGYHDAVLQAQDPDAAAVAASMLSYSDPGKPVLYAKHMAKQRAGAPRALVAAGRHALLVRRPEAVVASFAAVAAPDLHETCLPALMELYSEIRTITGSPPPIVLSEDLVADPEGTLRALCSALRLPFHPAMLSWPAGPKPAIDGVWAPWWYEGTWKSTGFGSSEGPTAAAATAAAALVPPPDPAARALLDECRPLYEFLRRRALRPASSAPPLPLDPDPAAAPPSAAPSGTGTHAHAPDPRNADVLVGIRDGVFRRFDLVWRPESSTDNRRCRESSLLCLHVRLMFPSIGPRLLAGAFGAFSRLPAALPPEMRLRWCWFGPLGRPALLSRLPWPRDSISWDGSRFRPPPAPFVWKYYL